MLSILKPKESPCQYLRDLFFIHSNAWKTDVFLLLGWAVLKMCYCVVSNILYSAVFNWHLQQYGNNLSMSTGFRRLNLMTTWRYYSAEPSFLVHSKSEPLRELVASLEQAMLKKWTIILAWWKERQIFQVKAPGFSDRAVYTWLTLLFVSAYILQDAYILTSNCISVTSNLFVSNEWGNGEETEDAAENADGEKGLACMICLSYWSGNIWCIQQGLDRIICRIISFVTGNHYGKDEIILKYSIALILMQSISVFL